MTFQLQDLCEAASDAAIRETLDELPIVLDETYVRKVRKVKDERRSQMVERIFKWLTCARRPLLAEELQEAVASTEMTTVGLLTRFPTSLPYCRLVRTLCFRSKTVHHSVLKFLLAERTELTPNPFHFKLLAANNLAAEVCVAYLSFQTQIASRPQDFAVQPELTTGGIRNIPLVLGLSSQIFSVLQRRITSHRLHGLLHQPQKPSLLPCCSRSIDSWSMLSRIGNTILLGYILSLSKWKTRYIRRPLPNPVGLHRTRRWYFHTGAGAKTMGHPISRT